MTAAVVLAVLLVGQAGPKDSQVFRSPGGDFTITMPGAPKEERSTDPAGPPSTSWTVEKDGRRYSVRCTPAALPPEKSAVLDLFNQIESTMVKSVKGQVIEKKDLVVDARPVREVVFEGSIPLPFGNYGVAAVRLFHAGGRAYSVMMAMPGDALAPSTRKEVEAYFASFRLTAPAEKLAEGTPTKPAMPSPSDSGKADWREYAPTKARYTVQMPGTPVEQESQPEIAGRKANVVASAVVAEGATFAVVQMTLPEPVPVKIADQFLEISTQGVLDEVQGTLARSRTVKQGPLAGRELDYEGKLADGTPGIFRSRLFVTGDRYYNLTVSAPPGKAPNREAKRFFESFKPEPPRATPKAGRPR